MFDRGLGSGVDGDRDCWRSESLCVLFFASLQGFGLCYGSSLFTHSSSVFPASGPGYNSCSWSRAYLDSAQAAALALALALALVLASTPTNVPLGRPLIAIGI